MKIHPVVTGFLVAVVGTLFTCLVGSVGIALTTDYEPKPRQPVAAPVVTGALPTWRTDVPAETPAPVTTTPPPKPTRKPTKAPTKAPTKKPTPKVTKTTPRPPSVYYKNCTAVRAAGADPLYQGEPGYRSGLDRDHDGVACED